MKSIRTDPANHAAEGDERIRTAEQAPGTDSVYDKRTAKLKEQRTLTRCVVVLSTYEREPFRWVECSCGWRSRLYVRLKALGQARDAHYAKHRGAAS